MYFNDKFFAVRARTNIEEEPGSICISASKGTGFVKAFSVEEAACEYTAWCFQIGAMTEFSFHEKPGEVSFLNGEPFNAASHPVGLLGYFLLVLITDFAPLHILGGIG